MKQLRGNLICVAYSNVLYYLGCAFIIFIATVTLTFGGLGIISIISILFLGLNVTLITIIGGALGSFVLLLVFYVIIFMLLKWTTRKRAYSNGFVYHERNNRFGEIFMFYNEIDDIYIDKEKETFIKFKWRGEGYYYIGKGQYGKCHSFLWEKFKKMAIEQEIKLKNNKQDTAS